MRTVIFMVTVFVSTVYFASRIVIAAVRGKKATPGGLYDQITKRWAGIVLRAAASPVIIRDEENVPAGPVVFLSTHSSFFDIWALLSGLPKPIRFVAKKELTRIPIFGRAMYAAEHVVIDRKNRQAAFAAYDEAGALIRSGISAVVFPEGTRSPTGEIQHFKKGPFVVAIAAQVPIVPVYVANSFHIMPKGSFRIRPRPLIIHYSDPISTEGMTYKDRDVLAEQVRAVLVELKARVDGEHPLD